MRKICSAGGCKTVVTVSPLDRTSPRCEKHQKRLSDAKPRKVYSHHYIDGKNVYKSSQWRKLRNLKASMNPHCEHCLKLGLVRPVKIVDHIVEIEDGGAVFELENLQSLCHACHEAKTAAEAKKRKQNHGFDSVGDF